MRSLFLKIFLSFWAALALSLVLAILATIALRPARRGIETQGLQTLAEAVNAYQSGGERGAHEYLEGIWHTQHVRAFVFDPRGTNWQDAPCPRGLRTFVRALTVRCGGPMRHRTWMDRLLPYRIIRQALTLDGKRYTLILSCPRPEVFFGAARCAGPGNHHRHHFVGTDVLFAGVVDDKSSNASARKRRRALRPEI